ncbi:MAG: hypothetical protein AABY10_01990 [Nanoarchaeota archaeon]
MAYLTVKFPKDPKEEVEISRYDDGRMYRVNYALEETAQGRTNGSKEKQTMLIEATSWEEADQIFKAVLQKRLKESSSETTRCVSSSIDEIVEDVYRKVHPTA